jgi:cytidylate kinase
MSKEITPLAPVIVIDGWSGTGKGATSSLLARFLKYYHLDSGVLYRAVGCKAKELGIGFADVNALVGIAQTLNIETKGTKVFLDRKDQTSLIRSNEAGMYAAAVAQIREVRLALREYQQSMQKHPGLVADGRDQAEIFNTPHCFFLKTSAEERAKRRFLQFKKMGIPADYRDIYQSIVERDRVDECNPAHPLKPHPKAIIIDNTNMTLKQVAQVILMCYMYPGVELLLPNPVEIKKVA